MRRSSLDFMSRAARARQMCIERSAPPCPAAAGSILTRLFTPKRVGSGKFPQSDVVFFPSLEGQRRLTSWQRRCTSVTRTQGVKYACRMRRLNLDGTFFPPRTFPRAKNQPAVFGIIIIFLLRSSIAIILFKSLSICSTDVFFSTFILPRVDPGCSNNGPVKKDV